MANLQLPGGDAPGVDMAADREIPSIRRAIRKSRKCRRLVEDALAFVRHRRLITSDDIMMLSKTVDIQVRTFDSLL